MYFLGNFSLIIEIYYPHLLGGLKGPLSPPQELEVGGRRPPVPSTTCIIDLFLFPVPSPPPWCCVHKYEYNYYAWVHYVPMNMNIAIMDQSITEIDIVLEYWWRNWQLYEGMHVLYIKSIGSYIMGGPAGGNIYICSLQNIFFSFFVWLKCVYFVQRERICM